jgi:hypothetical protein
MNLASTASLDQLWRSSTVPTWLALAAAGFFALILLVALLRAEKSIANVALTVITLLAIGIAVAATTRGFGPGDRSASSEIRPLQQVNPALPATSCIDDLAGETVLTACEKTLFGSPEAAAAALSYAASQITRLTAFGDADVANRSLTYELLALRHAIEHDRYGLIAQVLVVRDQCTPSQCGAFRSLTETRQVAANMNERTYDGLVSRYAPSWNAPAPVAVLSSSAPTGKPTNAEFPTAASIPPVNIMTPEPGSAAPSARVPATAAASAPASPSTANAALLSPRPTSSAAPAALAAAKKPSAPKRAAAPVQLAPTASAPGTESAPSAANE